MCDFGCWHLVFGSQSGVGNRDGWDVLGLDQVVSSRLRLLQKQGGLLSQGCLSQEIFDQYRAPSGSLMGV